MFGFVLDGWLSLGSIWLGRPAAEAVSRSFGLGVNKAAGLSFVFIAFGTSFAHDLLLMAKSEEQESV